MKILVEKISNQEARRADGLILSLKDFAVQSINYYDIDEIKEIIAANNDKEIFVNINKNILNEDIELLKEKLLELDKLNITGILFYDLGILELKRELNLKTDLVWSQTHMVNNYKTCNYYKSKGVNYALLGKEITLEEINEIINKSDITSLVEVIGFPTVAFSRRKLITNYYKDLGKDSKDTLDIGEKITNKTYTLQETKEGTSFFLKELVNGTGIIKELFDNNCQYIVMREYGLDNETFESLVSDTKDYIENNCSDESYVEKYKKLGDFTNFFFKKTIYKVKKDK